MSKDISLGGPCPPDCPFCAEMKLLEHELDCSPHSGEPPDGIMDMCPKCMADDPATFHYRGDWHRKMLALGENP